MHYIWGGMLLLGILYGICTGQVQELTGAILDGAGEGVELTLAMTGLLTFWMGILKVADGAGVLEWMGDRMQPILGYLFPDLPSDHPASRHMAANMIANVLGIGNAATPAGLRAMEALEELEEQRRAGLVSGPVREKGVASNEMCTFLIVNISSLQLIPMTMIAYRSQYGSPFPAVIVGPAILATLVSTGAGVLFCRLMGRRKT